MGPKALELAVEVYGADRILFGTDNPVFDDQRAIAAVTDSRLGDAEKDMIFEGNARALLSMVTAA